MLDIESDNISICEEPRIYYYSSASNIGVRAIFSERNVKEGKKYNMPFTPPLTLNNKFSFYNTIMLPSIKTDISIEEPKKIMILISII